MANGPQNQSPGRRSFRLSPLEMMIMGLIVVGVLYLVSIWILGTRVEEKKTPATSPRTLLDRALAATEMVRAQLASQKKELETALKRVKELDKALSAGDKLKDGPRLARRLTRLEKQVAALAKRETRSRGPAPQARLDQLEKEVARLKARPAPLTGDRLAKMEKRLARLEQERPSPAPPAKDSAALEKEVAALGKRLDQMAAREKAPPDATHQDQRLARLENQVQKLRLAAAIGGSGAKDAAPAHAAALAQLEARVQELEHALRQAQDSLRRVRAPVPDQELTARVAKLEKELAAARTTSVAPPTADRALKTRLAALERKLAALEKNRSQPRVSGPPRPAGHRTAAPKSPTRIKHRVRRGETLYAIARRYKVRVSDIKQWNPKLKKRRHLWVGEKLVIYRGG